MAQTVRNCRDKPGAGLNENSIVAADDFSREGTAHDREFTAKRCGLAVELSGDHTCAFENAIVELDFVGKPQNSGQTRAQTALCGELVSNREVRFFDSRTDIGGNQLEALGVAAIDGLHRKVSLPGM